MKLRTLFASFVLALLSAFLALPLAGCAQLASVLPDVIAYVQDGTQVLDAIDVFVNQYFAAHPNPTEQAKYTKAMADARAALQTALHAAQGTQHLDQASVDAAFSDFKAAYLELMTIVKPYGVSQSMYPSNKATVSDRGELLVPEPRAFQPLPKR